LRTGLMFAAAGMLGARVGALLGQWVAETVLLMLFAALMLWVTVAMWRKASKRPEEAGIVRAPGANRPPADSAVACRRDPAGRLTSTSRCAGVLGAAGTVTGVLSGLFGVGGGFVVVPALVLFSGMSIYRAVATSLLVIALVSASAVASKLLAGETLAVGLTML